MFLDIVRYLDFGMFGVGCAFMLVTNILAFNVLRPPMRFGFLWWHITTISVSFLCLGSVVLWMAFHNLGHPMTWRTPAAFVGFLMFMVAQGVIFSVELQRYASRLAAEMVSTKEI